MGDVRRNTSFSTVGRENDVFFKCFENDRRSFFFYVRRVFDVKLMLFIIYYLLVLILSMELYSVKVSKKSQKSHNKLSIN